MFSLESFTLDVVNLIRLNGFEVDFEATGSTPRITIFDPMNEVQRSIKLVGDSSRDALEQLATEFCTAEQRSQLRLLSKALAA